MALHDVIGVFSTGTYTVTRKTPGVYTEGRYVEAGTTSFTIDACIQPQGGRKLRIGPEGQSGDDVKVGWTLTPLSTRDPVNAPDIITYKSEPWIVFEVTTWEAFGGDGTGDHIQFYMARRVTP